MDARCSSIAAAEVDHLRSDPGLVRNAFDRGSHLFGRHIAGLCIIGRLLDDFGDLIGVLTRALGELADLLGDDDKALAMLAGARRLDRSIERQNMRAIGDLRDQLVIWFTLRLFCAMRSTIWARVSTEVRPFSTRRVALTAFSLARRVLRRHP